MERTAQINDEEDEVIDDTVKPCEKPWQESLEPVEEGSGVRETQGPGKLLESLQKIRERFYYPRSVCIGTLRDLFVLPHGTVLDPDGSTMTIKLWTEYGYPTYTLTTAMREIVDLVCGILYHGTTHWNLDPGCVSIRRGRSLFDPKVPYLRAGLSEEAIRKATEELRHEHVTHADDMVFALGCLLFFCVTGGKDLFVDDDDFRPRKILKNNPDLSSVEHISGATKKYADLSALEHIPEAMDLISTLLDPDTDNRDSDDWQKARVNEALLHPLFWPDLIKLRFLFEAGLKVNKRGGTLLDSVASVASAALCCSIDESNHYDVDKVPSLLRKIEQDFYPCYYHSEVLHDSKLEFELARYYMSSYPRLFFEVYKVMRRHDDPFITDFLRKQE